MTKSDVFPTELVRLIRGPALNIFDERELVLVDPQVSLILIVRESMFHYIIAQCVSVSLNVYL